MPLKNFANIGELQDYRYLRGTVTSVDSGNDTCDVTIGDKSLSAVPIFYHCNPDVAERDNGSLEGSAAAFAVDDAVVVLKSEDKAFVVAHMDEKKPCARGGLIMIRDNITGRCVLWDYKANAPPTGIPAVYANATLAGEAIAEEYGPGMYPDELHPSGAVAGTDITHTPALGISANGLCGIVDFGYESYIYDRPHTINGDAVVDHIKKTIECPDGNPTCSHGVFYNSEGYDCYGPMCYTNLDWCEYDPACIEYHTWSTYNILEIARPRGGYYVSLPNDADEKMYIYGWLEESGIRTRVAEIEYAVAPPGGGYTKQTFVETRDGSLTHTSNIDDLDGLGVTWAIENTHSRTDRMEAGELVSTVTGQSIWLDMAAFNKNGNGFPHGSVASSCSVGINTDEANMVYFGQVWNVEGGVSFQIFSHTDVAPIDSNDLSAGYRFSFSQCVQLNSSMIHSLLMPTSEITVYMIKQV